MTGFLKFAAASALCAAFGFAALTLASPAEAAGKASVASACKADAKKHCPKGTKATDEDFRACLEPHKEHVSAKCKKALEAK